MLLVMLAFPMMLSATLCCLPSSNATLAKRFEKNTEMAFRVKVGTAFFAQRGIVAYINNRNEARTASVLFPPTGELIYKILIFNDKDLGDSISLMLKISFLKKIYEIKEKIEFKPDQVLIVPKSCDFERIL
ncbi:MAG: hypothetical protein U0Z17_01505 [Bacteroidales bacterium]